VLDFASATPETMPEDVRAQFLELDKVAGDTLIVFGWAMLEDLEQLL